MTILLATLVVAFAAFCVWLVVRIVNRRERWAKWTLAAVMVGMPVLYVLGFGLGCWKFGRRDGPRIWETTLYRPILIIWMNSPRPLSKAFHWYANLGADREISCGSLPSGRLFIVEVP